MMEPFLAVMGLLQVWQIWAITSLDRSISRRMERAEDRIEKLEALRT